MVSGGSGSHSTAIDDLPGLVSRVAQDEGDRTALEFGGESVSYGALHQELTNLDTAMGGVLGADALVPLALSTVAPGAIESVAGGLESIVAHVVADARAVLGDFVSAAPAASAETLPGRFRAQVQRTPDAEALRFEGLSLTYAEFDARVNTLARRLVDLGVGPDTAVGLSISRSVELLVAMYAIVEAGGAYVPLDPAHPADRISYVLDIARPLLVLTTTAENTALPSGTSILYVDTEDLSGLSPVPMSDDERMRPLEPENTAYVIFTSGSTGRPKGVAVSHEAIVANLDWRQRDYPLTEADVVLQKTPFTFDVSVWEFFWPLQAGATLVIAAPDGHRDPAYIADAMARQGVTTAHFVPSMLAVFLGLFDSVATPSIPSLRQVFASGEALPAAAARRFHEVLDADLHNLYGPTEAAVDVTYHRTDDSDGVSVPIGVAVPRTELHVLDEGLGRTPPGVPGELYLAGVQLARGYMARPDLTADRFVADPAGDGTRMYRTGDLVRWNSDGVLEYLGRTDFQVKLRGLRIELGEIEAALVAQDDVRQAVVVVVSDDSDSGVDDRLVAYVVTVSGSVDADALSAGLRGRLPDYMVPGVFVGLDELPLNASGKLDRRALPKPDASVSAAEYRAPETDTERAVVRVFEDILGAERVGVDDDFFALGGNSLSATRAIARVNADLKVGVDVRGFFDAPTVVGLATLVDESGASELAVREPLTRQNRPDIVPLSLAQQRMWFLNRLDPESGANNIPIAVKLTGALDVSSMQAALGDLVARHETLRTVYPEQNGTGTQLVLDSAESPVLLATQPVAESEVAGTVFAAATAGFDVTTEVPVRASLLRTADEEHVLVVVLHHIAADGFSFGPLVRDLMTAYLARAAGGAPQWAPLPVHYADYTLWQRAYLGDPLDGGSIAGLQLSYWSERLAGLPAQLEIPTDFERPAVAAGIGRTIRMVVDSDVRAGAIELARQSQVTPFMVMHSALAILVARLAATTDIAIGAPTAGRGEPELDALIGMFVNTLVLRTDVDPGSTVEELLAAVRKTDLDAFANADVPFESVVEKLDPARSQGRHPLVQIALFFQNLEAESLELPGVVIGAVDIDATAAKFDLQVTVSDAEQGGWNLEFTYATDLFVESTMQRFASRLVSVLEQMCTDVGTRVGDIELLSESEIDILVRARNDTADSVPDGLVLDEFDARVAATPDARAVVSDGESLTYADLDGRVNAVAAQLISMNIGPDDLVAVAIRRSVDFVVAIYAVMRAGAAFVPIDPDHPIERVGHILTQAQPECVLVRGSDEFLPPADITAVDIGSAVGTIERPRVRRVGPDGLAYVIFTSGSTGKPKGVAVSHRAIVNQLDWMQSQYRLEPTDVYLQKTATTFDVSLWGYLWPLRHGTTLVLATPDGHRDPEYLASVIRREQVTVTDFVPTMLSVFASAVDSVSIESLDRIFVIGEALPVETIRAFGRVSSARTHNLYGPTEAAVSITYADVTDHAYGNSVDIGVPEANSQVYVLDSRLHPVPDGVTGELYLGGVQLARGYLGRPDLTAGRFVANPFATDSASSTRLYRTGDLVRWNSSERLDYLGRADFQVKFRGQRIELDEIEGALALQDAVAQAAVRVVATATGDQLVGYVIATPTATVDVESLRAELGSTLPSYMIPATVMVLDRFPLNTSGKLDRTALPEPTLSAARFEAPVDPVEQTVAAVFAEVLDVERVGRRDDFFALGGNSLVATRVVSRVSEALGTKVALRTLFEAPTVEDFAARIESHTGAMVPLRPQPRPERIPLSMAQQRMWFLNRLEPESAVNNIPVAIRLSGQLDCHALDRAVVDLLTRHESLRTVYPEIDGVGYQQVVPPHSVAPDLTPIPVDESQLIASIQEFVSGGFDVTSRVPLRAGLFQVSSNEHILVIVVHHIAADGYSVGPLARDVVRAYTTREEGLDLTWDPLPVQYADYTLWQREVLGSEDDPESILGAQKKFWQVQLDGLPEQLNLPFDRPRPAVASYRGATHRFVVPASVRVEVERLAAQQRSTPFMVVHAAIAVLLSRLSGTDDVAVGAPIAGRGEAALDGMIGMFVNTLVLRTRIDPNARFDEVLERIRVGDLNAFSNADIPFERLVEILDPARSTARHPLFQVALFFQNLGAAELVLPGLSVSAVEFDTGTAKFDLQIAVSDMADDGGWSVEFNYATDLFDPSGVESIEARLMRVLTTIVAEPSVVVGDIDLMSNDERVQLIRLGTGSEHEVDTVLLLDRFDAAVVEFPDSIAVVYENQSLTYREFSARVDELAGTLVRAGAGADNLVALAMRRSIDLVVGMYAVLRSGAGFVPIDPDHPAERVRYILSAADPICVLSRSEDDFNAPEPLPVIDVHDPPPTASAVESSRAKASPESVAYVIFTSGSTGNPKGVAVGHRSIVNQMEWMQSEYGLASEDVYLQKTATTFDVSLWGFFLPLQVGASLVLATPDGHRDPSYLAEVIARRSVTVTDFVPTMLSVFAAAVSRKSIETLKQIFVIGEALPSEAVRDFARVSDARVHNLYGPTEAAVSITYADVTDTAAGSAVSIGCPEWNCAVYVLDSRLAPVLPGVPGELYLAGVQLARGYYGRVDLTADRFVANPFTSSSSSASSRMYRTGDVVVQRPDGRLDYVGRTDFQVKFRGQRIELGEIESALVAHPAVALASVAVVATDAGDQLVGYVVPSAEAIIDVVGLRAALTEALPRYMVPSAIVALDEFPLNTSGKLDRKALPAPKFEATEFRAPTTPTEEAVANIFADVLGVERVGLDDDFFALGGNSLIATQFVARLGAALDSRVPVRDLFEASTVESLAARVQSHTGGHLELTAMPRPDRIPLSLAQQRMWFLNRLDADSAVNNIPVAVRLSGVLDVDALTAAVDDVVTRHEILRTVYPETAGTGIQVILPPTSVRTDFAVQQVDESDMYGTVVDLVTGGFDVTRTVPVRIRLLVTGATEHVLVVVAHHIAADGFSMIPLMRDVITAYIARIDGNAPDWAPLSVQYADYTLWQREVLGSADDPASLIAVQESYWKTSLAGHPDELVLPTDRPRPPAASGRGASLTRVLDERTTEAIDSLAAERGVTSFMVVHAALAVLLSRLSGSADVAVGTPVAGRGEAALDDVIGMFVNTLVLRTSVDGSSTFDEVLAGVREVDLAAFAHADVPFERVVEVVDPSRVQGLHPLVQVLLTFQNFGNTSFELPGLTASAVDFDAAVAKMDLQITVTEPHEQSDGRRSRTIEFIYATDLYDSSTVALMADQFLTVLSGAVTDPATAVGDIDIVGREVRERLLTQWSSSGPDVHVGGATLVDRFDSAVAAFPQSVALRYADTSLTYAELDARVNRLARRLIDTGAGPDSLVAVALPRSADLVVALLAVIKSGAGYLPVDPSYPRERVDFMLADAAPIAAVTTTEVLSGESAAGIRAAAVPILDVAQEDSSRSPSRVTDADRVAPLRGDNLAYVIYTSGSTGRPKGVQIPHHTVLRLIDNTDSFFGFDQTDVWTMFHSYAFDFSVWELWGPLLHGGTVVMVDYFTARSPEAFRELLVREGVTVLNQTPSAFYQLAESDREQEPQDANALALRFVIFGGEALEPRRLTGWFDRHGDGSTSGPLLVNMYGITETTVHVSLRALSAASVGSASVIGAPISGLGIYVLDNRLLPVPVGVAGELYVSGGQLARGYLGRADLSAARFIANPFGKGRLYRTGDVARWGHSESGGGDLIYLGRSDDQVKVRGFRIELGEIEAAVSAQDGVSATAVIVREDSPGAQRLVAYVVGTADVNALRAGVAELVPEYMVPSAFVAVDEIPLTVNGKLDRKALPEPKFEGREFREPASNTERVVAQVFADVLGVDKVGRDDDFFELGGNSLIATQVASRVGAALDATVPVRVVFDSSTVETFAVAIGELVGGGSRPALVAGERPARIPLSLAQQRMWVLNNLDPRSGSYNIPLAVRLSGNLDVSALERAVADVVARHESLRTVYPSDTDGPHQKILSAAEVTFDLTPRAVEDDRGAIAAIAEFVSAGFDVSRAVPVRIALFELSPGDRVLAVVVHHISADGASIAPLARDVMVAYATRANGSAPEWSELPVQYADFTLWQRQVVGTVDDPDSIASQQLRYWKTALAGSPDTVDLPLDRSRPATRTMRGHSVDFSVSDTTHAGLTAFSRDRGTSLFMLVHAALSVLLSRLSGSDDIVIGTPVAGRGAAELDELVGMFVNTLALRTVVDSGDTFSGLVDLVRTTDLGALSNADVPFEDVVDAVVPARSQARHPIFQVVLSFQNLERVHLNLPGLTVEGLDTGELAAKFDLQFTIEERIDEDGRPLGLFGSLLYATDLFDADTARSMAERLTYILDAVAENPYGIVGDIDIMTVHERRGAVALEPVETPLAPVTGGRTLAQTMSAVVESDSDAPAFVRAGDELPFSDVEGRSSRLARVLIEAGVGPGDDVVIALPVSVEWAVAVWAVALAGGVIVVGDNVNAPADSTEASRAQFVLGTSVAQVPEGVRLIAVDDPLTIDAIAAASPRPVDYSARTRILGAADPAVSVVRGDGHVARWTNAEVVDWLSKSNARLGISYDGRLAADRSTGEVWQLWTVLAAAVVGAAWVVPGAVENGGGNSDFAEQLADEWVTHAVVEADFARTVNVGDLEDLEALVVTGVNDTSEVSNASAEVELVTDLVPFDRG
ncbi:non-ribosomal peptide synthetase [Rhodococcus sp. ARC_M5]|uniref:non-ribosomal peptide synthetase n=1 Tax=Rhodococcus sp. ARC_M5 TaxID=2928851 RepID=UPI001FB3D77B|nr:non-ribosomal peptide synthetase [Rhodococcus sp. ARC_M5]MCJ0890812.1 amino acid adenylation domain-containing protein [Rhodococcus sp. ARC_M5]